MAIAIYVHPKGMTQQQYEEARRRLEEAGQGDPRGRLHHSCFGEDGGLMVYDVWESQEQWDAFGQALAPIATDIGVEMGEPMVMPIINLQQTAA